jgi:riboflavin kinase/FMN adenylyltransferase
MRLIRGLNRAALLGDCVATIGNFDGVHVGHQAIFKQVIALAKAHGLPSCVISFEPLPHEFFNKANTSPSRLHGFRDRVQNVANAGIDQLVLLTFDKAFSEQTPNEFIQHVLVQSINVKHLIIGDDFRFGHKRAGDFSLLVDQAQHAGYSVKQSDTVCIDGDRVSSTRVRQCLNAGQLDMAATLLGKHYCISGRVVHGEKVGRQLGFPTANIALRGHNPPLRGSFAVVAHDHTSGQSYAAVANLGERPTVEGRRLLLEVHLLDAKAELYGHHLQIDFMEFLRSEQKFGSLDELKNAINNDANEARRILFANPQLTMLSNRIH